MCWNPREGNAVSSNWMVTHRVAIVASVRVVLHLTHDCEGSVSLVHEAEGQRAHNS